MAKTSELLLGYKTALISSQKLSGVKNTQYPYGIHFCYPLGPWPALPQANILYKFIFLRVF